MSMLNPTFWWVIVGLALMMCEFAAPGLILFFFGIGALVTALVVWIFPVSLTVQLSVFSVASLIALFGLRRVLKPIFMGSTKAESGGLEEGLVGQTGTVTEAISPENPGKVSVNGVAWKAESLDVLAEKDRIVVSSQKSLTLIVEHRS